MKFHGVEIDLNGLAMLVSALTLAYSTWKGVKQRKKMKESDRETKILERGKEGEHDTIPD